MGSQPNAQRALALLGALLSFALLHATVASADITACATSPDAIVDTGSLTDTDRIIRELREMRMENVTSCNALRDAGVESRDATLASTVALSDKSDDVVSAIGDIPAPGDSGTTDHPAIVTVAKLDGNTVDAYNAMREVLWLVAGLLCALVVTPILTRVLFPVMK